MFVTNPLPMFARTIERTNTLKLCFFVFVIDFVITFIFSVLLFPEPEYGNKLELESIVDKILLMVIFAPLAETYVFQTLLLQGLVKLLKNRILASVIVAVFFGFAHWYSLPYILKAFCAGLLYNMLYIIIMDRKQNAFWYVALTHAWFNTVALGINELGS
jgi:membrane protease YdiL (CAAX protease family)